MYITYGKVFGGTPNIFMFWLFPENGSILERTVNRALIVNTTLYNSALTTTKNHFHFAMYQNYPLALICKSDSSPLHQHSKERFSSEIIHQIPNILKSNGLKRSVGDYRKPFVLWNQRSGEQQVWCSLLITPINGDSFQQTFSLNAGDMDYWNVSL